jgi:hypothetical protein
MKLEKVSEQKILTNKFALSVLQVEIAKLSKQSHYEEVVHSDVEGNEYINSIKDCLVSLVDFALEYDHHHPILDSFNGIPTDTYEDGMRVYTFKSLYQVLYASVPLPTYRPSEAAEAAIVALLSDMYNLSQLEN